MINKLVHPDTTIGAIILAAGLSLRMGQPKMLLEWGNTTIIQQVVKTVAEADVSDIVVVTGALHEEIERELSGLPVRLVHNPDFANGEMIYSLKTGIQALSSVQWAMITLGDQPRIDCNVLRLLIKTCASSKNSIVIPSYQMRRGHPWLVFRDLWQEIIRIEPPLTLRHFLNEHKDRIHYVNVDTDSILQDIDTPEDYTTQKPA